ncbi:MAG TPA: phosphoribosylglycinamide formyltransferase [Thermoplasmata archaeon]|nr:phosphoribosylglycinamide formyltransferase [Thermoplasmata archaeon]
MGSPLEVAVLVSGEGTTLDGLATRLERSRGPFGIALVVADRPGIRALEVAARHGLPHVMLGRPGADAAGWSARLSAALEAHGIDLVVLAGFLSILPPPFLERWAGRAVNLHPSLLPRYGGRGMHGRRVHEAVLQAGEAETGVTVHLVTGAVDAGPPIAQARLAVRPDDTPESLRERLRPVEVDLLYRTLERFARGELALPYSPERAAGTAPR